MTQTPSRSSQSHSHVFPCPADFSHPTILPTRIQVWPSPIAAVHLLLQDPPPGNPAYEEARKTAMRETAIPMSGDENSRRNTKTARSSLPRARNTKPEVLGVPPSGPRRATKSHRPAHAPSRQRQPLADNAHQHMSPTSSLVKPRRNSQDGKTNTQSRPRPERPRGTNTTQITTAERVYRRPLATDSERTAALWKRVRDTKAYQMAPIT